LFPEISTSETTTFDEMEPYIDDKCLNNLHRIDGAAHDGDTVTAFTVVVGKGDVCSHVDGQTIILQKEIPCGKRSVEAQSSDEPD